MMIQLANSADRALILWGKLGGTSERTLMHPDALNKVEKWHCSLYLVLPLAKQLAEIIINIIFITAWNDSSQISGVYSNQLNKINGEIT